MENNTIQKKILAVMAAVQSVSKDGVNAFHKYKYVTDAAIVTEIRKALIDNKLTCIPRQLSCTLVGDLTTLLVEYEIFDADKGDSIKTQVFGYGQDKGDKGVYKAATGAEKYFLLKTFLIPTDDDPENEGPKLPYRPKSAAVPEEGNPYITNPEAITLFKLLGGDKEKQKKFKDYLTQLGIDGTNKIKREGDYNKVYEFIIKLNDEVAK